MTGIFKAYDIRGVFGQELNQETAYQIGLALSKEVFPAKAEILVSKDMRTHSDELVLYLINGLVEGGCQIIYAGLCATPMNYWANSNYQVAGSIQVTASHNGAEYNGFKISGPKATPIDYLTGLKRVESSLESMKESKEQEKKEKKIFSLEELSKSQKLKTVEEEVLPLYLDFMSQFLNLGQIDKNNKNSRKRKLKIAIDAANGMAGFFIREFLKGCQSFLEPVELYWELDGNFPNHEADPLKSENLAALRKKVLAERCDLGVAFDGDADRCVFVDQNGRIISADLITALIAEELIDQIREHSPETPVSILYDLRSSRIVKETVESKAALAFRTRVGHSFIKRLLKEKDALFAGELSGHYYFADCFYTDSALRAFICLLNILEKHNTKNLAELIDKYSKYQQSGEINFQVKNSQEVLEKVKQTYQERYLNSTIDNLDGLTVEVTGKFWFNLRSSNTENSLLRMNFEAYDGSKFERHFVELKELLVSLNY